MPDAGGQEVEVRLDGIDYVTQRNNFFRVRYALTLPSSASQPKAFLALDVTGGHADRVGFAARHHKLPSVEVPALPLRPGRSSSSVNLPEDQAKYLLWLMCVHNLWQKPLRTCLVVTTVNAGGVDTAVSEPVDLECPYQPAYFGDFPAGRIKWTRALGQALHDRKIPYETPGCLLLRVPLPGVVVWFFHVSHKLKAASDTRLARGVNCITFADAAVGTDLDDVVGKYGDAIATAAGATPVRDGVNGDEVRAFFNETDRPIWEKQSFIFWYEHHVVVIHEGIVCEYALSAGEKGDYRETAVRDFMKQFKGTSLLHLSRL